MVFTLQTILDKLIAVYTPFQYVLFTIATIISVVFTYSQIRRQIVITEGIKYVILFISILQIGFLCFLWVNHIGFPLNLEPMELTVLQHVIRIRSGLPLYPEPSSNFVALAYHPLYYYLSVPFTYLFGANLFAIRFVAIIGMAGICLLVYIIIFRNTNSNWLALVALAVFASAYRVMETYLDNAFPDSWMMLSILLGCYLIDLKRSNFWNILGIVSLVLSYWFKQPGAAFVVGGVLFLTWRDGIRKSWPYWLIAILFGPVLYFLIPDWVLGPRFHYFTWEIPRHWIQFDAYHIAKTVFFLVKSYTALAAISLSTWVYYIMRKRKEINIWFAMIPFAMVTTLSGLLDPESAKNLYIPLGTWFIITGTLGINHWVKRSPSSELAGKHVFAILISFGIMFYDPRAVIIHPQAEQAYHDMVDFLNSINGSVYSPWVGQLQSGYKFYPSVHWVPMVDMVRPGYQYSVSPVMMNILEPVIHPQKAAYIFTPIPLDQDPALYFLSDYYILDDDFGDRYKDLNPLPKEYNIGWPRYFYRYVYQGQ